MLCTARGMVPVAIQYVTYVWFHLVVIDRVDQPISVALGCCTLIKRHESEKRKRKRKKRQDKKSKTRQDKTKKGIKGRKKEKMSY